MTQPTRIGSQPGIGRDGTQFDGQTHVDGEWVRWQRKRPRKMWGYRSVTVELPEISRGLHVASGNGQMYLHSGGIEGLHQVKTDRYGILTQLTDRTPAALVNSLDNLWQFDMLWSTVTGSNRLIAHATPSLSDIDSTTDASIFFGDVRDTAILTDTGTDCSGGIVALPPYLIAFGADGKFAWSVPNDPADFTNAGSGESRIAGGKILVGKRVRGTGSGPAGLLWTQDELLRVSFTTGGTTWNSDVLAETSLLSSRCVVEYDGVFYWPGVERFLMFSGVQRELPNEFSYNYFFDNLNMAQRQKAFGFKNPRWGEIWWCVATGNSTEANHAFIFNVRENCWYDTPLPDGGRSAAAYAQTYPRPFMAGVDSRDDAYTLWQHETGLDKADQSSVEPIRSFYETAETSLLTSDKPEDRGLRVARIEPDFVQAGPIEITVIGRPNARAVDVEGETKTILETPTSPVEETIPVRESHRIIRFRVESDTVGGDMQAGETLAQLDVGDARVNS